MLRAQPDEKSPSLRGTTSSGSDGDEKENSYQQGTTAMGRYLLCCHGLLVRPLVTCDKADPNCNDNLYYIIDTGGSSSKNNWKFFHRGKGNKSDRVRWKHPNNIKPDGDKYKWRFGLDGAGDDTTEYLHVQDYCDCDVIAQLLGRSNCATEVYIVEVSRCVRTTQ